jgi:hypothetical protein
MRRLAYIVMIPITGLVGFMIGRGLARRPASSGGQGSVVARFGGESHGELPFLSQDDLSARFGLQLAEAVSLSLAASTHQRSPLPAEFAPIRWDTDPTRLSELFPGAELDQTEYGGTLGQPRRKQFGVSGVERPVLGAAGIIIVTAAESGTIESVKLVTEERRPECSPTGALGAPRSCRWRYSRALVDVFKRMRETLSVRYGPGVASPTRKSHEPGTLFGDLAAISCIWHWTAERRRAIGP